MKKNIYSVAKMVLENSETESFEQVLTQGKEFFTKKNNVFLVCNINISGFKRLVDDFKTEKASFSLNLLDGIYEPLGSGIDGESLDEAKMKLNLSLSNIDDDEYNELIRYTLKNEKTGKHYWLKRVELHNRLN